MLLRTAALYDRDPRELETPPRCWPCAACTRRSTPPVPPCCPCEIHRCPRNRPRAARGGRGSQRLRAVDLWRVSVRPLRPAQRGAHPWVKTAIGGLVGVTVWVITWVFPLSLMLAMAWGWDTSARALGRRALIFYDQEPEARKRRSPPPGSNATPDITSAGSSARPADSLGGDPDCIHRVHRPGAQRTGIPRSPPSGLWLRSPS